VRLHSSAFFFMGFMLLLISAVAVPRGHYVLVIGDPWAPPGAIMDTIGKAGGALVAAGRSPWVAVAYSETDNFPSRLMGAGAFLVLNHRLAEGCQQKDTL
jgi:hypothetical protein